MPLKIKLLKEIKDFLDYKKIDFYVCTPMFVRLKRFKRALIFILWIEVSSIKLHDSPVKLNSSKFFTILMDKFGQLEQFPFLAKISL